MRLIILDIRDSCPGGPERSRNGPSERSMILLGHQNCRWFGGPILREYLDISIHVPHILPLDWWVVDPEITIEEY